MMQPLAGNVRALGGALPVVLDTSNNNPATRQQLLASRAVGLWCKASEGGGFVDDVYQGQRELARSLGIAFGGYLFLHPGSHGDEADFFLEHAKPERGDLQPFIDCEVRDGASFQAVAARVDSCALRLQHFGYTPILYSYTGFLQQLLAARPGLARLRILQASYTWRRPRVGHRATVIGWQYTHRLPAAGGHFDASRLYVPLQSLRVGAAR